MSEIESLRDECKRMACIACLGRPLALHRKLEEVIDRLAGAVSQPNLTVLRAWSALQEAEPGDRWAEGYDAARTYVAMQLFAQQEPKP